jgi:DNA-directed RNA polymerase specialized sigma24 family protein
VSRKRGQPEADLDKVTGLICERYLPGVYRYVRFCVNDQPTAEELTLGAFRKVMSAYNRGFKPDENFSMLVFAAARKEIQDYLREGPNKPTWTGLSSQEQEVISLRMGAFLDNQRISKILNLPEKTVERITAESLNRLRTVWPSISPCR